MSISEQWIESTKKNLAFQNRQVFIKIGGVSFFYYIIQQVELFCANANGSNEHFDSNVRCKAGLNF